MAPASSCLRTDLHLWLRHRHGACQPGEHFSALATGAAVRAHLGGQASYGYLGDMLVRYVFEGAGAATAPASEQDLGQLRLTPDGALLQAMVNLRRTYGAPRATLLECGVHGLQCEAQELASSYLLDRVFWNGQLERFPQGLLAAVPRPETLVFVPADDTLLEATLGEHAARIMQRAGDKRISGYLYRFDAVGWRVHGPLPALAPAPAVQATAAPPARVPVPATLSARLLRAARRAHIGLRRALHRV